MGKTYIENLLLKKTRGNGDIALIVASLGIATLFLDGGRTTHSRFKIPIELDSISTCGIRKQSDLAALIRRVKLILWDEAPIVNKLASEAVDRTLKDIIENEEPFGGIVFVMSGDFCQVLPIVQKGTRAEIVSSSIKESTLWNYVQILRLQTNMQAAEPHVVYNDLDGRTFVQWLLYLGEKKLPSVEDEFVQCLTSMLLNGKSLIDAIYPGIGDVGVGTSREYLSERAILVLHNEEVSGLNSAILNRLHGDIMEYLIADQADDVEVA